MTTSGTYNFSPGLGELTLYAFNVAGVRSPSITQAHMESARMASNLILGRWSSKGVNLWQVDLQTVGLVQGQASYSVPANTIAILDAYITQTQGSSSTNRVILPVSRSEYASYSNPTQQGGITTFWFDRLLSPTLTTYQVCDGTVSQLSYYRLRQAQDANFTGGQTVEIPVYWLEAFADALAYRMAKIWNPEKAPGLKIDAAESYLDAIDQNTEQANVYISPQLGSYFQT